MDTLTIRKYKVPRVRLCPQISILIKLGSREKQSSARGEHEAKRVNEVQRRSIGANSQFAKFRAVAIVASAARETIRQNHSSWHS